MTAGGIDFGTSNTLAAVRTADGLRVCEVDPANGDPQLLPSHLYLSRNRWSRIGREATRGYQQEPDGRFIRALKAALPEFTADDTFRIFKETYTLPGLAALLLRRVRERLEAMTGSPVTAATLGRPVHFSRDERTDRRCQEMLREAAEEAGFTRIRFLTEPEAATRYHFSEASADGAESVLVFDFGGGTLDLCLARFGRGEYRVLATGGASIGGTLLDRILFEKKLLRHLGAGRPWGRGLELPRYLFDKLVNPDQSWRLTETEYATEVRQILNATVAAGASAGPLHAFFTVVSKRLGPDLFTAIETAKMELSEVKQTEIRYQADGVAIREPLSRAELRELFREPLDAMRELVRETLSRGRMRAKDVDRVVLAGGSSALICTQELLRDLFGAERVPARQDLFTSIVRGLALDAARENVTRET
jgi:hypothetical chaperone protein